jgi:diaminopimelate decarboxylase/aspartate kinase
MKFGGTSVSSFKNWETIVELIEERLLAGYRLLVVHSALSGVSDLLESTLQKMDTQETEECLQKLLSIHTELAKGMGLEELDFLKPELFKLEELLSDSNFVDGVAPQLQANVMAVGELLATRLGAAFLEARGLQVNWMDARTLLRSVNLPETSEQAHFVSARCEFMPDITLQEDLCQSKGTIITQGFIASDQQGQGVLLGRGGSDTSAAYLAAKLQALGLEIWTDVPGIFSADPRSVPGARHLRALSYQEAQEIASTGSAVLHPRCIRPVYQEKIPLRVRSTARPELPGTLISSDPGSDAPLVKAIAGRTGITLVSMETLGMWHKAGFLASAFKCFSDLGLSVDLVSTSESNVTLTLDTGMDSLDDEVLERLRTRLERLCRVRIIRDVEVVSLIGQKIRTILHKLGPALELFEEYRIHLVSQSASDLNLSFVVENGQSQRLISNLHPALVQEATDEDVFGYTWEEMEQGSSEMVSAERPWWEQKREQLLEIAESTSEAYVYDLNTVRKAICRLKEMNSVGQIYYAIKANFHPEILRSVYDLGANLECVSPGEIQHVLDLFPDISPKRILFTPNFAPRKEYEESLAKGVWVTLDNLYPLRYWGDMLSGREIFLRLDTGQGRGHHRHVRTAGVHSKFGIPLFELDEARELVEKCGASVVGLHAHTGSGILQAGNWKEVGEKLVKAARQFPDVRFLDLGGGLGIPDKVNQQGLDLQALDDNLTQIRQLAGRYELWLEPGRYLVAEAGVLLTHVTQIKGKGSVRYVGVSTGMNSLIRPALYGAYHEILNLSRIDEPARHVVSIVGPICETGDRLGSDRHLPECREGDVMLIANCGAYGYVMGSRYNLREPAQQVVI